MLGHVKVRGKLTFADMVQLGVRLADKLVVSAGSARGQPQDESDVAIVKRPHGVRVAQQGMDVGSVEETGSSIVERDGETLLGLAAEDGKQNRIEIALWEARSDKIN